MYSSIAKIVRRMAFNLGLCSEEPSEKNQTDQTHHEMCLIGNEFTEHEKVTSFQNERFGQYKNLMMNFYALYQEARSSMRETEIERVYEEMEKIRSDMRGDPEWEMQWEPFHTLLVGIHYVRSDPGNNGYMPFH